ncbi:MULTISPECIES: rhomboid family intramembrane serine protease [unclassified Burkholderia]|uniref:rhomboid family intramembrane serine protease n=1 Tax=unclassified Burkholderia TaxID=2613784 RepID=UPI000F5781C2|nr:MULTISPECIES: rhomboid family intramembrane serine protease [unclassified Burkholderia]RQR46077.1 rhomboid family intramembrane serine protease [Burkholderia sp. Bp9131]RQR78795.1 rhomboid family intramembrane serine protease [Burkholderia sp. Bp9015]RQS14177.1 rhomboid family intramembrane serine protease [Burkholderia sp. Bp8991]RQS30041.1 rhomboid family intramembrane serine protease [Burkholderia sp. Bp8995]RQS46435.1 rhomboid family intramembrane serine protease [Burkholderia sp. Bp899
MTYALILVNFAVFIAEASGWPVLIDLFALWPPARSGAPATPDFHVWQLLTYSVLHASLAHVAFNMFGLYMFGRDVERVLGRARFLALYLASVLAGAIAQLGVMRALPPADAPTVGASAGVFGALIAYAVLFPKRRVVLLFPPVPMPAWLFAAGYALTELLSGLSGDTSGVAHFAHLGGMLGALVCLAFWRKRAGMRA